MSFSSFSFFFFSPFFFPSPHHLLPPPVIKCCGCQGSGYLHGKRERTDFDRTRSASSLGMMSEEERKMQRIEDIKELLS